MSDGTNDTLATKLGRAVWGLAAAIILSGLGTYLSARYASGLEYEKYCRSREDERGKELRSMLAEYQRETTLMTFRANSLAEHADDTKKLPTKQEYQQYVQDVAKPYADLQNAYLSLWVFAPNSRQSLARIHGDFISREVELRTLLRGEPVPGMKPSSPEDQFAQKYKEMAAATSAFVRDVAAKEADVAVSERQIEACVRKKSN